MARKQNRRSFKRVIAGIRVSLDYDYDRLDITIRPNEDDLRTAPTASLLQLWEEMAKWSYAVAVNNPGWKIDGERPVPDPDREVDENGEDTSNEGTQDAEGYDPTRSYPG